MAELERRKVSQDDLAENRNPPPKSSDTQVPLRGVFGSAALALFCSALYAYLGTAGVVDMRPAISLLILTWVFWVAFTVDLWWGRWNRRNNTLAVISLVEMTVILATIHIWVIEWAKSQELAKKQADTYRFLASRVILPPFAERPMESHFSIVNNASSAIGKYEMRCGINLIVNKSKRPAIEGPSLQAQFYDGPIQGNGDSSETDECLSGITFSDGEPSCLDISLWVIYSLQDQPNVRRCKSFRYVGIEDGDKYLWLTEPAAMKHSLCLSYLSVEGKAKQEEVDREFAKIPQPAKIPGSEECNF